MDNNELLQRLEICHEWQSKAILELRELTKNEGKGRKVHPHIIRHTTATDMLRNGATLTEVQYYLGHEDPSTTQIYTSISAENIKLAHKRCVL